MSIKRRIQVMEKILESESFSKIPKSERIVWAKGYTQEEREIQMAEKVAALHKKYEDFDENCLTRIYIRIFSRERVTTCRKHIIIPEANTQNVPSLIK
jgi:hypothetical protein